MNSSATSSRQARNRGIAMIEFVIVLPLCLMLMLATAEFGRAFMNYNTLTQSVRHGVRFAASNALLGSTGNVVINSTVRGRAQNLVVYGNTVGTGSPVLPGLTPGDVTVADAGAGNISVSVAYPYSSIFSYVPGFSFAANWALDGVNLQAAITMRAL